MRQRAVSTQTLPKTAAGRQTTPARLRLFAALAVLALSAPAVGQESTTEALQAEIEHLRIVVDVKQQKIRALERELESFRRQDSVRRRSEIAAEILREVERLRGLRARHPVDVAPMTEETVRKMIDEEIAEQFPQEQFQGWETLLKHLGLVPSGMNMQEFLGGLFAEQAAGLYDDKTKKLYVSDKFDLDSGVARMILAHELCHALQDQHFNLTSSPIHLKTNDDRGLGALSMIEGDAMLLMSEYLVENVGWKVLFELPKVLMMDQQQLAAAPPFFTAALIFPYMQGMQFVMDRFMSSGPRERNRLLRNFPRSTEQIIHPEKYDGFGRDEPTEITLDALTSAGLIPAEDRYNNVLGEFGIQAFLDQKLPALEAQAAAAGWDGDRIVFGGPIDGDYALAWLSIWDDPEEAREFAEALGRYFRKQRSGLAEAQDKPDAVMVWLSDEKGFVAIARAGARVICVHTRDRDRAARLLSAARAIDVERVP